MTTTLGLLSVARFFAVSAEEIEAPSTTQTKIIAQRAIVVLFVFIRLYSLIVDERGS
jgi:hypothetical protein